MKKYGRIFLTLAVLFGLAAQAQATSYDPTNLIAPTAQNLVRMNQGNLGDALIGDFYRATIGTNFEGELNNANFLTYVSITNTSNDWVAAHVRLRSGRYSIEIVDFPILLSPHDVFWFQFEGLDNGSGQLGGVRLWSSDLQTIRKSGLPIVNGEWVANLDATILNDFARLPADQRSVQEMAIGYLEVIGLWRVVAPGGVTLTEDVMAGVDFFDLMGGFFQNGSVLLDPINTASVRVAPGDVGNVLTGQVFMGDFTNGLYTGYSMTALADFRSSCTAVRHRDNVVRTALGITEPWNPGNANGGPIVYRALSTNNAGNFDAVYRDPDWATSFGPTLNDGDDWTTVVAAPVATLPIDVQSYSLDEVDDAMAKAKITSTYFNGGFRVEKSTFTMSVITFPTKFLHTNFRFVSATGTVTFWPVGRPVEANNVRQTLDVAGSVGVVSLFGRIFDLEERAPFDPFSPQAITGLKYEVNCLPIGELSRNKLSEFCFLTHDDSPIDVDGSFFAGWYELQGFGLLAGVGNSDPRSTLDANYGREPLVTANGAFLPLLNCLATRPDAAGFGYDRLIPALVQTLDWEFANFPHARSFTPGFDNPNNCTVLFPFTPPACPPSPARF